MICDICPHFCDLQNEQTGKCLVVKNSNGNIHNPFDGIISSLNIDSIEKRPLFHYQPGMKFLSVSSYGCSFSCDFCFNFSVSQKTDDGKKLSVLDLVNIHKQKQTKGICFTFNEPSLSYKYIKDLSQLEQNIVLKTNGFFNQHIADILLKSTKAWNIDIKGDDAEYQRICKGFLQPVLDIIEYSYNKIHLEISYLVLPRIVDDYNFHEYIRNFVYALNPNMPFHLLYYYPFHNMTESCYPMCNLIKLKEFFREKLNYVYISNTTQKKVKNTYCPSCNDLLIEREGVVKINKLICCNTSVITV